MGLLIWNTWNKMSPRNWSVCPQCSLRRSLEIEKFDKDLRNEYGKISIEDFEKLKLTIPPFIEKPTLAQYYEFWFDEPSRKFFYTFHFTCRECGFGLDHQNSIKADFKSTDENICDKC